MSVCYPKTFSNPFSFSSPFFLSSLSLRALLQPHHPLCTPPRARLSADIHFSFAPAYSLDSLAPRPALKAENNPPFFSYLNPRQQPPVKMSSSDDDVPLVKGRANGSEFSHYISAFRKVACFTRKHCPRCFFGPVVPIVLLKFHPSLTLLYHHQTSSHFPYLLTLLPTCSEVARQNTQKRRQSHGQRETLKRSRRPRCFHSHGSCRGDGRGHATCKWPHEWEAEGSKRYHEWQELQGSKQLRGR